MAGAPRFAVPADAEPLDQAPERPSGWVVSRVKVQRSGLRRRGQFHLDRGDEPVTEAISGFYDVLILVSERIAEPADALRQYGFAEDSPGPYAREQLILGADFVAALQQKDQDFEGFALEPGVDSIDEQLQCPFIENCAGKVPAPAASVRLFSVIHIFSMSLSGDGQDWSSAVAYRVVQPGAMPGIANDKPR